MPDLSSMQATIKVSDIYPDAARLQFALDHNLPDYEATEFRKPVAGETWLQPDNYCATSGTGTFVSIPRYPRIILTKKKRLKITFTEIGRVAPGGEVPAGSRYTYLNGEIVFFSSTPFRAGEQSTVILFSREETTI